MRNFLRRPWALLLTLLSPMAFATSPPPGTLFTYEGVLTDSSNNPLTGVQTVTFQISYGTCILFSETQDVTPGSSGEFSVSVGNGNRQDSTGNTADRIFAAGGSVNCSGGSPVTVPGFADRSLHIKVGSTDLTPDVTVNNIPFAINSMKLADHDATEFVQKVGISSDAGTCTGTNKFLTWDPATSKFGCATASGLSTPINLATDITGTLPIANGGTGATTANTAFKALSPLTTKGDLIGYDGSTPVRLGVGTTGQVLSADSTQTSGLKWTTPTTGTVTSVTGTSPITVANTTSTPTVSVNTATSSALGVVQVGAGLAVTSGVVSADPTNFPSVVPVTKGGTGVASLTPSHLIAADGAGSTFTEFHCGLGQYISFDATGIAGCTTFPSYFTNSGNSFGAAAVLGTNDSFLLSFKTAGATAMTIDTSHNVGIGISTPNVSGQTGVVLTVAGGGTSLTDTGNLELVNPGTTAVGQQVGKVTFTSSQNGTTKASAQIVSALEGTGGANGYGGKLMFSVKADNSPSSTFALTINSAGYVGVGTVSPTSKFQVGASGDGTVAIANAWNVFSDRRLKTDISPLKNACEMVDQLNGYYYYWKVGEDHTRQVGVIAQEVEAVLPELVHTNSEGIKTVDYSKLSAVLIEVSKQHNRDIASLKSANEQIKKENQDLKKDLELIKSKLGLK